MTVFKPFVKSIWVQLIFSLEIVELVFANKNHGDSFSGTFCSSLKGFGVGK